MRTYYCFVNLTNGSSGQQTCRIENLWNRPQSTILSSSCVEGDLQTRGRKLNQPGSVGEFRRSGKQAVYNTHETEILSCKDIKAGLGGRSWVFSVYKVCDFGTILYLSQSQRNRRHRAWILWNPERGGLGNPTSGIWGLSCRSGAGLQVSVHPTEKLWANPTHPTCRSPGGWERSALNTQQHAEVPPGANVLTCLPRSPVPMLGFPVSPNPSADGSTDVIFLAQPLDFGGISTRPSFLLLFLPLGGTPQPNFDSQGPTNQFPYGPRANL